VNLVLKMGSVKKVKELNGEEFEYFIKGRERRKLCRYKRIFLSMGLEF